MCPRMAFRSSTPVAKHHPPPALDIGRLPAHAGTGRAPKCPPHVRITCLPHNQSSRDLIYWIHSENGTPLSLIVNLNVPDEVILGRISDRWVHLPSGRVYNMSYNRPKVDGLDDETGEPLTKRPDDNPVCSALSHWLDLSLTISCRRHLPADWRNTTRLRPRYWSSIKNLPASPLQDTRTNTHTSLLSPFNPHTSLRSRLSQARRRMRSGPS